MLPHLDLLRRYSMGHEIYVIKRDGRKETFNFNKVMKVVNFASKGLQDVNLDEFYQEFQFVFKVGITTKELQQKLISTANKLTVKDGQVNPDYSIFANRLFLMDFWKEFKHKREEEYNTMTDEFGFFKNSDKWIEHLEKYVELGVYDERILKVSKETLRHLYTYAKRVNIKFDDGTLGCGHFMWNNFFYQTLKFYKSYLIRYEGFPIENFDEALLLISIMGFYPDYKQDKELFIKNVKQFYWHLVKYHFIPATPQLLNLRRKNGNLSSCNIFDMHDNLESIMYTASQVAFISKRAGGIGVYGGRLRPSGSYLMGNPGLANHFNMWGKIFNDIVVAVNQSGVRKGSCTIALPCWHKDVIEFINCKNPLGDQRLKLYDIFPQIILNDTFMKAVENNDDWYLVDHYEIQKLDKSINLIDAVGEEFEQQWEKVKRYIQEGKLKNYKKIKARSLIIEIGKNVTATGLPYVFFEDTVNRFSPFKEKIHCGNLCMESFSPFRNTNPEHKKLHECIREDEQGYAHSCNLFSLNLPKLYEDGILFNNKKLQILMSLVVRYMDNIIEMTEPPVIEIKNHNRLFRTIGIGFLGLADLFVKLSVDRNTLYTYRFTKRSNNDEELRDQLRDKLISLIQEIFGPITFYGIKASIDLAKERGVAKKYNETKWKDLVLLGHIPIEEDFEISAKIEFNVDEEEIVELREDLKKYGIRNTMLFNCPPNTSTSLYAGTTASIMPAYAPFQTESQRSATYFVFPRYIKYGPLMYDFIVTYDEEDVFDLVDVISFIQKYIDSGISFEYPLNHKKIKNIPVFFFKFLMKCWKSNIKTLYYARNITVQGNQEKDECIGCAN